MYWLSNTGNIHIPIEYSNHLNTGLAWYSNGRFVSGCQMAWYLNGEYRTPILASLQMSLVFRCSATPAELSRTGSPAKNILGRIKVSRV